MQTYILAKHVYMAEHTHMYICHYVQRRSADAGVQRKASAAEERRRASAAVGKAAEGKLGEAEDSGWDEELPRARPPPPPCPRGWPTMLGEAPPAGEGEEAEEEIVSWSPAASPSLLNSLVAAPQPRSRSATLSAACSRSTAQPAAALAPSAALLPRSPSAAPPASVLVTSPAASAPPLRSAASAPPPDGRAA